MRAFSYRSTAAAFVALIAFAGCAERNPVDPGGPTPTPRDFTVNELAVASANTGFGFELLKRVHPAADEANVLLSPLSASLALGMALNGARAGTYDAMRSALGFGELPEEQVNAAYRGLIDQLRARDPKVEFRLANSAWTREGFPFEEPFLEAARQHFDAEVRGLDFLDPASPGVINAWASEATGGRIDAIVEEIDPLDILFLLNAVYFKAPWAVPFTPDATHDDDFQTLAGATIRVPTMIRDAETPWYQDDEVVVADLPYADGAFSMTLVRPADGRTLDDVVAALSPAQWDSWLGSLQAGRLMLRVPKFRFEFDSSLVDPLEDMGMGIAFRPRDADFGRITTARDDVHISEVRQKAFIDVHERGTEAAAVTSVTVSVTSMPPLVRFDRPFLFAIREAESGAILFLGRVGDPSAG